MTILVTGVAGFIGHHVAMALAARGDTVTGIDNLDAYYSTRLKRDRLEIQGNHIRFVETDFADDAALADALDGIAFDRIIHLGAQPGVRYSIEKPAAYARANLLGHLNVLELGRQRAVRHLVYASSSSVYGGGAGVPLGVGERVDRPVSLYAATKRADELMSESYASLYRLPQTGLRFFTVYGPWGRPDMAVWMFTDAILAGQPIQVYNRGAMRRDFTYIDDIVAGILAALDRPPDDDGAIKPGGSSTPHAIYNLGNNRAEQLGRLIDVIEAACGRPAIRDYQPMQAGDVQATYADISESRRDLGFDPATSIDVGVPSFVDWFRSYRAG